MISELLLIQNIQKDTDVNESLKQLTALHSGIVFKQIHNFLPSSSGIYKQDLLQEKELFIFNAAKSYDPTRGCKFSTWVGDNVWWTLSKMFKKVKEDVPPPPPDEPEEEKIEMVAEIFDFLKRETDEKTVKVFELRHLEPTNGRLMGWHDIGDRMGCSHEWSRRLYMDGLKKVKEHFSTQ